MKFVWFGMDMYCEVVFCVFGSCDDEVCGKVKVIMYVWNYGQGLKGVLVYIGFLLKMIREFDNGMKVVFLVLCCWCDWICWMVEWIGFVFSKWGRLLWVIFGQEYIQVFVQVGQLIIRDLLCDGLFRMDCEVLEMLVFVIYDEIVLEVFENCVEEIVGKVMKVFIIFFEIVLIMCGVSLVLKSWIGCYEKVVQFGISRLVGVCIGFVGFWCFFGIVFCVGFFLCW